MMETLAGKLELNPLKETNLGMAQVLKETHLNPQHFLSYRDAVADPDLQIRGSGHPDPEMGGGGASLPKIFLVWSKNKGGAPGPPGPLPGIRHWITIYFVTHNLKRYVYWLSVLPCV